MVLDDPNAEKWADPKDNMWAGCLSHRQIVSFVAEGARPIMRPIGQLHKNYYVIKIQFNDNIIDRKHH